MSRPTRVLNGFKSKLSLDIPIGWHVIAAAISRKSYNQVIKVYNTIDGQDNFLVSEHGKVLETMKELGGGGNSLAIGANRKPMKLDFEWFYSTTSAATDHTRAEIAKPENKSEAIQVRAIPDPPEESETTGIPDFVTFMVFVEDDRTQGTGDHGIYDDGVATIHCVKESDNAEDSDSDSDF